MKRANRIGRIAAAIFVVTMLMARSQSRAQPTGGAPVALSQAAGKTGALRVTMTDRSPLSAPAEIGKRVNLKADELAKDYDLTKQVFDVYIPPKPAEDGKYGLMDGVVFADGHGFAPAAWKPVLDKRHLIWIAPSTGGDSQPALSRIGYALDALANATKTWPIDEQRIYLSLNVGVESPPACMALYYPDLFPAVLSTARVGWFANVPLSGNPPQFFKIEGTPPPPTQYLNMAKTRSRIFFAHRESSEPNRIDIDDLMIHRLYEQGGFRNVKAIKVTRPEMDVWTTYAGTWLDQGIQYLESTKTAAKPASQPATRPAAAETDSTTSAAERALSTAKSYISAKRYDLARTRLQSIITDYPNTQAAKDAQSLLKDIAGK